MSSSTSSLLKSTPELRRRIWDGVVPIQIILAASEARTLSDIPPYFANARRMSYFPLLFSEITAYFKPYLRNPDTADSLEWWLEFEDVPLRWNWPIGLIYDLLTGLDPSQSDNPDHDWHLPWTLVLHFNKYPTETVLRLQSKNDLVEYWMNRIKEADFVRRGNATTVMNLSKADSTNLWTGVETHNYTMFWTVASKLLPHDPLSLRHIPIKIYLPSSNKVLHALVPPSLSLREPHTVGSALHQYLPDLFPSRRACLIARPILHGATLGMMIPLAELLYECMYTDGYLHICIVMIS
ncbi:autophagy protein Apg5-domain-containing protein [Kockiozyma suomiensis]|uniref:autophagy protein Apg5-domain-containing protein n=1 Tax=Kockiozyma suomiensis TaxID=1337062 RepID=UPI003343ACE4